MSRQTFILEIDSDTHPAVLTAHIRMEMGLCIGKGAYTLQNAEESEWHDEEDQFWFVAGVLQYDGCDPKLARDDLHRVDL